MKDTKITGNIAEDAVTRILMRKGLKLVARNYSIPNIGELDIVMVKGRYLYVIEVKSRLENNLQSPIDAIDRNKRNKILKTTRIFMLREGYTDYDVIFLAGCVTHNREGVVQKIEIIPFE